MQRPQRASFRCGGTVLAAAAASIAGAFWPAFAVAAEVEAPMVLRVGITGPAGTQADTIRVSDAATLSYDRDGPLYRIAFEARRADNCTLVLADVRYSPAGFELVPLKAVLPPRRVRIGETTTSTSSDSLRLDFSLAGTDRCDAPPAPPVGDGATRTCIGVMPVSVEDAKLSRRMRGQLTDAPEGLVVWSVFAMSPAAAAGLRQGDVLLSLDGTPLRNLADFNSAMRARRPGESFEADVYRGGEWVRVAVTAGERKNAGGSALQCVRPLYAVSGLDRLPES